MESFAVKSASILTSFVMGLMTAETGEWLVAFFV